MKCTSVFRRVRDEIREWLKDEVIPGASASTGTAAVDNGVGVAAAGADEVKRAWVGRPCLDLPTVRPGVAELHLMLLHARVVEDAGVVRKVIKAAAFETGLRLEVADVVFRVVDTLAFRASPQVIG